jgi:hypothetical protein
MMQQCQPNHYVMKFRSSHFNSSYMTLVVSTKITNRRRPVAKFLVWNQKKASIGLLFSDRSTRNKKRCSICLCDDMTQEVAKCMVPWFSIMYITIMNNPLNCWVLCEKNCGHMYYIIPVLVRYHKSLLNSQKGKSIARWQD